MKSFFSLFLLMAMLSCKKDSPDTTPTSKISFKADGISYSYSGDWNPFTLTGCSIDPLFVNVLGYITLVGVQTPNTNGFEAHIHATSVEVKTYNNVEFLATLSGVNYTTSSDCTVTINRIQKGRASGSFSGKISYQGASHDVNITEGIFTDVLIR